MITQLVETVKTMCFSHHIVWEKEGLMLSLMTAMTIYLNTDTVFSVCVPAHYCTSCQVYVYDYADYVNVESVLELLWDEPLGRCANDFSDV